MPSLEKRIEKALMLKSEGMSFKRVEQALNELLAAVTNEQLTQAEFIRLLSKQSGQFGILGLSAHHLYGSRKAFSSGIQLLKAAQAQYKDLTADELFNLISKPINHYWLCLSLNNSKRLDKEAIEQNLVHLLEKIYKSNVSPKRILALLADHYHINKYTKFTLLHLSLQELSDDYAKYLRLFLDKLINQDSSLLSDVFSTWSKYETDGFNRYTAFTVTAKYCKFMGFLEMMNRYWNSGISTNEIINLLKKNSNFNWTGHTREQVNTLAFIRKFQPSSTYSQAKIFLSTLELHIETGAPPFDIFKEQFDESYFHQLLHDIQIGKDYKKQCIALLHAHVKADNPNARVTYEKFQQLESARLLHLSRSKHFTKAEALSNAAINGSQASFKELHTPSLRESSPAYFYHLGLVYLERVRQRQQGVKSKAVSLSKPFAYKRTTSASLAVKYFHQALEKKLPHAHLGLAYCAMESIDTGRDLVKGLLHFHQAALLGLKEGDAALSEWSKKLKTQPKEAILALILIGLRQSLEGGAANFYDVEDSALRQAYEYSPLLFLETVSQLREHMKVISPRGYFALTAIVHAQSSQSEINNKLKILLKPSDFDLPAPKSMDKIQLVKYCINTIGSILIYLHVNYLYYNAKILFDTHEFPLDLRAFFIFAVRELIQQQSDDVTHIETIKPIIEQLEQDNYQLPEELQTIIGSLRSVHAVAHTADAVCSSTLNDEFITKQYNTSHDDIKQQREQLLKRLSVLYLDNPKTKPLITQAAIQAGLVDPISHEIFLDARTVTSIPINKNGPAIDIQLEYASYQKIIREDRKDPLHAGYQLLNHQTTTGYEPPIWSAFIRELEHFVDQQEQRYTIAIQSRTVVFDNDTDAFTVGQRSKTDTSPAQAARFQGVMPSHTTSNAMKAEESIIELKHSKAK